MTGILELANNCHYTRKSSHYTQTNILLVYKNFLIKKEKNKKQKTKKNYYYNILNIYTNYTQFLHKGQ